MKIETIIINCLKKNINGINESDAFFDGISEYASDNSMDSFIKDDQPIEVTEFVVSSFMQPFYSMPVEKVNSFFKNYSLIKNFNLLSNEVFGLACEKYKHGNATVPADLEERINLCISKIYLNKELEKLYMMEISDVIMDIDFVKGKTDKLSLRLARTVR